MLYLPSRVALFALLFASVCLYADGGKDKKGKPQFEISQEEQELIDLSNEARRKENLPPLKANKLLFEVARGHAANMASHKQIDHVLDGKGTGQRLLAAGYAFSKCAENIAAGQGQSLADVFKAWMKTPVQKGNILRKQYRDIGIGIAVGEDNQTYYVQEFGRTLQ